jgi:hypothetical protein
MSLQDIYNKALFGIRGQGYRPSSTGNGGCKYHIPQSGLRCAVGHCIPDDVAGRWDDAEAGDTDIASISLKFPEDYAQFFSEYQLPFLQALQCVHDTTRQAYSFESAMEKLAETYSLVYTPVVYTENT